MGAVAGAVGAMVMLVIGVIFSIAYPDSVTAGSLSEMDAALVTLFDFHFVPAETSSSTVEHLSVTMFGHFDQFDPPAAALGLLYLLPALFLYKAGKTVTRLHGTDDLSLQDSALAGASVVLGYLPIIVVAAILAPSDPLEIDVATGIVLPGLVYPLLFGAIGGLAAGYYYPGELRSAQGYAVLVPFLSLVLVFLTTFVTVEDIPSGADEMLGRFITTIFATAGAFTLNLDASGLGLAPYAILIALFAGSGFLVVNRGPEVPTPFQAFAKGMTLTSTYVVVAALVFTVGAVFTSTYLAFSEMPEAYDVVNAAADSGALGGDFGEPLTEIGKYVEGILISSVVYPIILGGGGGALAWWYENNQTQQRRGRQVQQRR